MLFMHRDAFPVAQDERLKLNEELLELQNAKMNLEQVIAQNMEKTDRMERGMQMVAIERDETLELLQRAVRQKEEIRMNRRKEVEEVQEDLGHMSQTLRGLVLRSSSLCFLGLLHISVVRRAHSG